MESETPLGDRIMTEAAAVIEVWGVPLNAFDGTASVLPGEDTKQSTLENHGIS